MYAIAIVRYRKQLDEVLLHVEAHRAYLRGLKENGILIASGPLDPRNAGALLLRLPDDSAPESLDAIRDGDPFVRKGVAQYEIWPWLPNIGKELLDAIPVDRAGS